MKYLQGGNRSTALKASNPTWNEPRGTRHFNYFQQVEFLGRVLIQPSQVGLSTYPAGPATKG